MTLASGQLLAVIIIHELKPLFGTLVLRDFKDFLGLFVRRLPLGLGHHLIDGRAVHVLIHIVDNLSI